ncbi:BolA family protein [Aliidiomarina sp. Khilg15.8]
MSLQETIETRLRETFTPAFLGVDNESHMHGGLATESHFKVTIASEAFEGKRLLSRHRAINEQLEDLFAQGLHALSLHTYTPAEWKERAQAPDSPACRGGSQTG